MDPARLVAYHQQKLGFSPLFFGCSGREAEYELIDQSDSVLWIGSGALLLGSSVLHHKK
jgi:hypothetical protein